MRVTLSQQKPANSVSDGDTMATAAPSDDQSCAAQQQQPQQTQQPQQAQRTGKRKNIRLSHQQAKRMRSDVPFLLYQPWNFDSVSFGAAPVSVGSPVRLYDRVIVDAECTHDASIKHILKYKEQWGWHTMERRVLNDERLSQLEPLQRGLLRRGFSLLKPGGTLIYSTCSFAKRQNEDVVTWLLDTEPSAKTLPITNLAEAPCVAGSLQHTIRFDPVSSRTSGLFIAKLTKT
eukprot:TRINITY_DN2475_c0_g2_i2.p1 TRINITY_DN2475_c0_g2~~TRINITY_DN2475_c0_g2_i2.p1  ORF type:complete len:232 (+),score=64.12 TRINITY_DN2475_c0_g2_i2:601-1296(+)